jgi:Plavaka transposase
MVSQALVQVPISFGFSASRPLRITLHVREHVSTVANLFGLYWTYYAMTPTATLPAPAPAPVPKPVAIELGYGACENASQFLMQFWYWMIGSRKTRESRATIVDLVNTPNFNPQDLLGTNWQALDEALAQPHVLDARQRLRRNDTSRQRYDQGGWAERDVEIAIPFKKRKVFYPHNPDTDSERSRDNIFTVPSLFIRSIPHLIRRLASTESHSRKWTWEAQEGFWRVKNEGEERTLRVYGEVTSSQAFLDAEKQIRIRSRIAECSLPRAVVALMVWSDSTHLGDFTDASLHPVYLGFGNESKYTRGEPTSRAIHEVALLPKARHLLDSSNETNRHLRLGMKSMISWSNTVSQRARTANFWLIVVES